MNWGIIGALDAEVALIKEQMNVEKTLTIYGSDFITGTIGTERVTVVCSSIGTINAAACASSLIREFGAEAVVNVGIAGAMGKGLKVLDVVVSEDTVFHDKDHSVLEKYYPFKRSYAASPKLIEQCVHAIKSLESPPNYQIGRVATGDVFVNDPVLKAKIAGDYAPLCVEMEGAAVGQIATMGNIPFLVIRTLSDNADENADQTYDNFLERAAYQSANIILNMIRGEN